MKIESFAGRVNVFGVERGFALADGDELRISKLTTEEASRLLLFLEKLPPMPAEAPRPAEHPNHVEEERTRREVEPPKARRTKAAAEPPKAAEAPKPEPVKDPEPEAKAEVEIPFGKPEPESPKPAGGNGGAVAEQVKANESAGRLALAGSKRLVDVITALQEQGITGIEAIVAECERLRPEVPLLDRIPDMRERVERALLTLGQ